MNFLSRSAAILALTVLPALAQTAPEAPARPAPEPSRLARVLGLTETQRASIRAIREKHQPAMAALRASARQAQGAFRAALRDGATADAQLRTLHDQASSARFELLLAGRSLRQEMRAVLTPEQRAKAAELRDLARVHHREHTRRFHARMGFAAEP
ncbi:Spy/CpxP family protein refolding chaperone [Geothrix sp. 21YS21S-4]|uniref:Spy/CpxP family protein refolding chaperone n=1 Tax=Geothrix sp. 21YS21S-4 TaxID=3068889 RepID=UPI0027B9B82A|nr:Spy/CpxP family protein refolding chaperone [Geothrix sp. 21YS21S-4]